MLRKLFTLLCLCGFVVTISACSTGHGTEVKKGDPEKKTTHKEKSDADPDSTRGVAGPDE